MFSKPVLAVLPPQLLEHAQDDKADVQADDGDNVVVPEEADLVLEFTVWEPSGEDQHEEACGVNNEFVNDFNVIEDWF